MDVYFINFDESTYKESISLINDSSIELKVHNHFFIDNFNIDTGGKTIRNFDASFLINEFSKIASNSNNNLFICKYPTNHPKRWFFDEDSGSLLITVNRLGNLPVYKLLMLVFSAYYSSVAFTGLVKHSGECCFNMKANKTVFTSVMCDDCNHAIGDDVTKVQAVMNNCIDYNRSNTTELFNDKPHHDWTSIIKQWWVVCLILGIFGFAVSLFVAKYYPINIAFGVLVAIIVSLFNPKRRYLKLAIAIASASIISGVATLFSGRLDYSQKINEGHISLALELGKSLPFWAYLVSGLLVAYLVWMDHKQN